MTEGANEVSVGLSDSPHLVIDGTTAMNECIERVFLACRRSLIIRARRLDFAFYFSESFTECCQSVVKQGLRNEILFLVEDEQYLMRTNTRLVTLARQFSSYIKIRAIPEEYIEHQEMFIVCDDIAYVHQPNIEHPKGLLNTSDRGTARKLGLRFKDLWQRSIPPPELFSIGL
ncbi:MAG: hypothetical protein MAG794_01601 [Gammaproteobacteria bacterium]|nr:hypothetical protein [Gammaproteobacteria bacterium]